MQTAGWEPRRIMQTEFGPEGNCQSACLAMMLGLDLADVPNFALGNANDGEAYSAAQAAWLAERGLWLLTVGKHYTSPWPPRGFYIGGGTSSRGNRHSAICKDGAVWHDPHPDQTGLEEIDEADFVLPLLGGGCMSSDPTEHTRDGATNPPNPILSERGE